MQASHRTSRFRVAVALTWLAASLPALAQCAMCKQALLSSSEGQRLASSLNAAILLLLAAPFLVVGAIAFCVVHAHRRRTARPLEHSGVACARFPWRAYLELTKPRIVAMVLVTAAVGFFLGGEGIHSPWLLLATLVGLGGTAGGAAVLNNYLERDLDAKMERTRNRPLPSGVVSPSSALAWGIILVLSGTVLLAGTVNLLTGFLALLAAFLYVLVYTALKRVTWLNTTIGAIPGAIPPLCGWAAAAGQLDWGAWALFSILFAWQHPHFYALAWLFRDDYARAGFKMLPVLEPDGASTFRQTILFSILLLAASLWPSALGIAGGIYLVGALFLGLAFLTIALRAAAARTSQAARHVFLASVTYLPVLWALLLLDNAALG